METEGELEVKYEVITGFCTALVLDCGGSLTLSCWCSGSESRLQFSYMYVLLYCRLSVPSANASFNGVLLSIRMSETEKIMCGIGGNGRITRY